MISNTDCRNNQYSISDYLVFSKNKYLSSYNCNIVLKYTYSLIFKKSIWQLSSAVSTIPCLLFLFLSSLAVIFLLSFIVSFTLLLLLSFLFKVSLHSLHFQPLFLLLSSFIPLSYFPLPLSLLKWGSPSISNFPIILGMFWIFPSVVDLS